MSYLLCRDGAIESAFPAKRDLLADADIILFRPAITSDLLLANRKTPGREEIREHISGNYCRCTGYHAIVDAIESVAQARAGK
jgi:hypothetical protein